MVQPGQAVQEEHCRQGGEERPADHAVDNDGDKRRPAVQRPVTDDPGVADDVGVPAHKPGGDSADATPGQAGKWNPGLVKADCLGQSLDWKRRECLGAQVSGSPRLLSGAENLLG